MTKFFKCGWFMTKVSLELPKADKELSMEVIRKFLSENHAAYVLVTCSEPSQKGEMQAEMFHEGDECLISYLVDNARHILDHPKDLNRNSIKSL
jgi:hypothetical protein